MPNPPGLPGFGINILLIYFGAILLFGQQYPKPKGKGHFDYWLKVHLYPTGLAFKAKQDLAYLLGPLLLVWAFARIFFR